MADNTSSSDRPNPVELTTEYANNSYFEPTIWDLKILFGEFSARLSGVDWHTSITVPWPQAKLMAYYLTINVAFHEITDGPVTIPQAVMPPPPPPVPESDKDNPVSQAMYAFASAFHQKLISGQGKPPVP
jgi:hypothetical protein